MFQAFCLGYISIYKPQKEWWPHLKTHVELPVEKKEENPIPLLNLYGICSHQVVGAAFACFYYKQNERILNYLKEDAILL